MIATELEIRGILYLSIISLQSQIAFKLQYYKEDYHKSKQNFITKAFCFFQSNSFIFCQQVYVIKQYRSGYITDGYYLITMSWYQRSYNEFLERTCVFFFFVYNVVRLIAMSLKYEQVYYSLNLRFTSDFPIDNVEFFSFHFYLLYIYHIYLAYLSQLSYHIRIQNSTLIYLFHGNITVMSLFIITYQIQNKRSTNPFIFHLPR